jgi:signal transduction histidine kinase
VALGGVLVAAALLRARGLVLAAGAGAAAAQVAYAVALLQSPRESPHRLRFELLFYGRALFVLVFAVALLGGVALTWRRRASILGLARVLADGPAPGRLRDALADALGDPTLDVVYWLPRSRGYVDRDGKAFDPAAADVRVVTPIVRNGVPVAAVLHDPTVAADAFERALGSAARLAVENERLHTEVRAQLEALRRSRKRITERADAERRRLERDLHDGAQQRLLALLYDLKLAGSSAEGEVAGQLDAAAEEAQLALEELRQLAHGIYPAILTEAGLQPALASLADDAPIAVELTAFDRRYDEPLEAAVYVAVREAIDDAAARDATWIRVSVEQRSGTLELAIEDDGAPRATELVHVQDRMGALGGTVDVGRRTLAAVIPCG